MNFVYKISTRLPLLALGCAMAACSSESLPDPSGVGAGQPTLAISIGLSGSTRAGDAPEGDFEPGQGYENHLDIAGDDYRIYFFNNDNQYVATFDPYIKPEMNPDPDKINNVDTYFYDFVGKIPPDVGTNFKLVVLANWGKYPEETETATEGTFSLVKGETTIESLTTTPKASNTPANPNAKFSHLSAPAEGEDWLGPDRLIPFYGVRAYDIANMEGVKEYIDNDGRLTKDVFVNLQTAELALPVIRAMAKVEVILENPFASFESVEMTAVNSEGHCAPYSPAETWKFDYTDYFHDYNWSTDFFRGVHLTGSGNANDADPQTLAFKKVNARSEADGKITPEKWVAYVPEYRNIGDGLDKDGFTTIKVKLAKPANVTDTVWNALEEGKKTNLIYFAPDGSEANNNTNAQATRNPDGSFTAGRFNIERNNIYRFTVAGMTTTLSCQVDIQPFAEQKLLMDFGLMRDERGDLKVMPDAEGNLPKYFTDYMYNHGKDWPKDANNNKIEPQLEGDYYAIVLGPDGLMKNAEIWLKDREGCRVMTNFAQRDDNSEECSSRWVIHFLGLNETRYKKDKDGERRIHHFGNHYKIVLDTHGRLVYKDPNNDDDKRRFVESWDEESKECWIILNEKVSEDGSEVTTTFRKVDTNGDLTEETNTVTEPVIKVAEQGEESN